MMFPAHSAAHFSVIRGRLPPGATEELAARLAELARDPKLRERMGKAGRERVLPRYAVQRLVDDVDLLYQSLLSAEENGRGQTPSGSDPTRAGA